MDLPSDNPGYLVRKDEDSIYNMVTPKLQSRLESAYLILEKYEEDEILTHTKINDVEHDLRLSFWKEYDYCRANGKNMNMTRIYHGVCSQPYWDRVINDDFKLAYILTPPKEYAIQIESMLVRGLARLNEIIKLPITDDKGRINVKVAGLIRDTVDMLDKRRYGMYTQKNVNINKVQVENKSIGNIDEELAKLEAIERDLPKLLDVSDAEVVE